MSDSHSQRHMSPPASNSKFARACERCRNQKLACKPGSTGNDYPCHRCEDSGKIMRQQATLEGLSSQLYEMQQKLAGFNEIKARLAALEARSNGEPSKHGEITITPPPIPSLSSRAHSEKEQPTYADAESLTIVNDFEMADMNASRLLSDVRLYRTSGKQKLGKRKRMEDEVNAARIAFMVFTVRCMPAMTFIDASDPTITPNQTRERSPLLFWSIVAVGTRESPDLQDTYITAHENTLDLLRQSLGGRKPTYWDLVGAMVYNKWLAPIRPIGHIVDLAYELDIHRTYDMIRDKMCPSEDEVRRVRLWIAITIQDYFYSCSTGRPPHYPYRQRALEQSRWLVSLPGALRNDFRLLSTYEYEEIAHSIQEEATRRVSLPDDWETLVEARITAIVEWRDRWMGIAETKSRPDELNPMTSSVQLNFVQGKLAVYTVVLRGIRTAQELTDKTMKYAKLSVTAAREACQLCYSEFQPPAIQYIGESQLFVFVSAAIFLLKVIWLIPDLDDIPTMFTQIEQVISTLEGINGQLHAHFLSQLLRHVKNRVALSQSATIQPETLLPPNGADTPGYLNSLGFSEFLENTGTVDEFWSWLSVDGQSFSPLVSTLDTFDASVPMGGL